MELDLQQLRQQYEALSDQALLEIDRDDLVDAARQCYDKELQLRKLRPKRREKEEAIDIDVDPADFDWGGREEPAWLPEAISVFSVSLTRWTGAAQRMHEAVDVLTSAGIPCYVSKIEEDPTKGRVEQEYQLTVPPKHHLQALSVLDKDLLNAEMEADWKAHFGSMSDDDLLELDEDALVAGMRDRIERLIRAYEDELLKRGLAELETESGN